MTPDSQASGIVPELRILLNSLTYMGKKMSHEDLIYSFVILSKPLALPFVSCLTTFLISASVISLSRLFSKLTSEGYSASGSSSHIIFELRSLKS